MAKLEELVTPTELLDVIREGALKNQVIKKYRTTEQELAMMLLPLYRSGDLTKEEFNDFFKGIPLRPREALETVTEDEAPSQILRSLSEAAELRAPEPRQAPTVEVTPPPIEDLPEVATPVPAEVSAKEALETEAPVVEAIEDFEEFAEVEVEEAELVEEKPPVAVPKPVIAVRPSAEMAPDLGALANALQVIVAKLTSIDSHLANIEKNLKSS